MKQRLLVTSTVLAFSLAGCGTDSDNLEPAEQPAHEETGDHNSEHHHGNHSSSGEVPDNLKVADNPSYPVGSKAMMEANHMPGMKGTEATIVGAYKTTAYAVSYTPTTGEAPVENHKWVIHEELQGHEDQAYAPGDTVVINADHMEGMDGAEAVIDSSEQTTVYMVDFEIDGETVQNHKWVTEEELRSP
ncbi:YdhK family protein [Shouchella tritolerans]|uniref:YdhK family protein n=1 Tax=Shouchella tritolerans TaxID=2979466 RepID=UPI0021E85C0E|nr:YdhK family protein [Shouchella tritolerans]